MNEQEKYDKIVEDAEHKYNSAVYLYALYDLETGLFVNETSSLKPIGGFNNGFGFGPLYDGPAALYPDGSVMTLIATWDAIVEFALRNIQSTDSSFNDEFRDRVPHIIVVPIIDGEADFTNGAILMDVEVSHV